MYWFLSQCMYSFLLGLYLGMELLGHMVALCLTFEELSDCFPKWLHPYTSLPAMNEGFDVSTYFPTLVIICHFDYSHPSGCEVGLSQDSKYSSLKASDAEHLFIKLSTTCLFSLEKCLFRSFASSCCCCFFNFYLFFQLHQIYVAAHRILNCSMQTQWHHVGSSSLTRDRIPAFCTGIAES